MRNKAYKWMFNGVGIGLYLMGVLTMASTKGIPEARKPPIAVKHEQISNVMDVLWDRSKDLGSLLNSPYRNKSLIDYIGTDKNELRRVDNSIGETKKDLVEIESNDEYKHYLEQVDSVKNSKVKRITLGAIEGIFGCIGLYLSRKFKDREKKEKEI